MEWGMANVGPEGSAKVEAYNALTCRVAERAEPVLLQICLCEERTQTVGA